MNRVTVLIIIIAGFLLLVACGPGPYIIEDGGPPIITGVYEEWGQIRIQWVSWGGYEYVLHRFSLNEKGDLWNPEFAVNVEGRFYLDDYNLKTGTVYGYVVVDSTTFSRSDLRAIKYSGVDISVPPDKL